MIITKRIIRYPLGMDLAIIILEPIILTRLLITLVLIKILSAMRRISLKILYLIKMGILLERDQKFRKSGDLIELWDSI